MPAVALRNALCRENQELCDKFIYCSISFKHSPNPLLAFDYPLRAMSSWQVVLLLYLILSLIDYLRKAFSPDECALIQKESTVAPPKWPDPNAS